MRLSRTNHNSPIRIALLAVWASLLVTNPAQAGRSCEESKPTTATIERGLNLAEKTMKALDASGQKVVMLARAGQDLSKYGVRYSHLGFAYKQTDGKGGHAWRVLHKLNHCGTSNAALYRQGLGQFFLDDLWRYEAAYSVLDPAVQDALLPVLQNDRQATRLHHQPYSIVSYTWGRKYQQSNQWAIETLALAIAPGTASRGDAQVWLRQKDYRSTVLRIDPLTRLGGRLSAANVAFDDHPPEKRFSDRIETVTVDSVFAWLDRSGLGNRATIIN